jgi:signal peptidase I
VLRRTGGTFYPKSTLQEYVEFLLVAAIVIIGIRTYFVQPFKIPTNSMWPTYYGMTPEAYPDPSIAPGPIGKAIRFVLFGAQHYEVVPQNSGRVAVRIFMDVNGGAHVFYQKGRGRKWLVVPTDTKEFSIYVERREYKISVPADFEFDEAFYKSIGWTEEQFNEAGQHAMRLTDFTRMLTIDREAVVGRPLISFDILTGDQLFVDRLSYHFFPPKVGDGFVFRTDGIEKIGRDEYFIKRLVGLPGDTMEVHAPYLYRNRKPITGAKAFESNQNKVAPYRGYSYFGDLAEGQKITVPINGYYAMGDNSYNSDDSRYWGPVPKANVVGRPLFIYYPFTRRWGPAH